VAEFKTGKKFSGATNLVEMESVFRACLARMRHKFRYVYSRTVLAVLKMFSLNESCAGMSLNK